MKPVASTPVCAFFANRPEAASLPPLGRAGCALYGGRFGRQVLFAPPFRAGRSVTGLRIIEAAGEGSSLVLPPRRNGREDLYGALPRFCKGGQEKIQTTVTRAKRRLPTWTTCGPPDGTRKPLSVMRSPSMRTAPCCTMRMPSELLDTRPA